VLAKIFKREKMPASAKDLADMIMASYTSTDDPYHTAATVLDAVVTKLKVRNVAKSPPVKRRVPKMHLTPARRELFSAISRSCQPRHNDEYP